MKFILKKMEKTKNRRAVFVCSLSYKNIKGKIVTVVGKLEGNISSGTFKPSRPWSHIVDPA